MHRGMGILIVKTSSGGLRPRFESWRSQDQDLTMLQECYKPIFFVFSAYVYIYIYICRKCLNALFLLDRKSVV